MPVDFNRPVIWVHAALAVLIILLAWRWHHKHQPYEFKFQNLLDTWLYFSGGRGRGPSLSPRSPASSRTSTLPTFLTAPMRWRWTLLSCGTRGLDDLSHSVEEFLGISAADYDVATAAPLNHFLDAELSRLGVEA